jgi:hypothetical protein
MHIEVLHVSWRLLGVSVLPSEAAHEKRQHTTTFVAY